MAEAVSKLYLGFCCKLVFCLAIVGIIAECMTKPLFAGRNDAAFAYRLPFGLLR